MTERADQIRALLGGDPADATAIAEQTATACQALANHVARLVGELGVRTLFDRSIHLASPRYPWLAQSGAAGDGFETLRGNLERQDAPTSLDAGCHVLSTFIGLLERFIGSALVANLLFEVWPTSFPSAAVKETQ